MAIGNINDTLRKRFLAMGEEFHYESFPEDLHSIYSVPMEYIVNAMEPAYNNNMGKMEKYNYLTGYITKAYINAATCDENSGSIIYIHSSVPLLLFRLCVHYTYCCNIENALASGNPIYNQFGQKEKIILRQESKEIFPEGVLGHFNRLKESNIYKAIESEGKLKYALYLYDLATRFLAMHECMHVVLGHTAYMQKKFGFNEFLAFSDNKESDINELRTLQALEFISDRHTAPGVFTQSLQDNLFFNYFELENDITVEKECFVARSVVNALCILFRLFPYKWSIISETIEKKHPHPYIRLQWIITELSTYLGDSSNHVEYIMRPMVQSIVVFHENFEIQDDWLEINEQNQVDGNNKLFSDVAYTKVVEEAKKIQHEIYLLSPTYEGDNR